MKIKTILIMISLGLLVWLLISNVFQLDIAPTKNNSLINSEKIKVNNFQNIDSVKTFAKSKLNIIREIHSSKSLIATRSIWIIIGLFFTQLILLILSIKKKQV